MELTRLFHHIQIKDTTCGDRPAGLVQCPVDKLKQSRAITCVLRLTFEYQSDLLLGESHKNERVQYKKDEPDLIK